MPYQPAVLGPNARLNNFRLNYLTAAQAAERPTHLRILLGGVDIGKPDAVPRVLHKSLTIKDVVFDQPNTCALTLYGGAPTVGQRLEVWIGTDPATLLFAGELQTVERTYKGRPATVIHPCTAIDDTAAANRKQPLMRFANVSATTIAQTLISTYCPGFSAAGVELGLPPVTVNFDGSEGGLKGCLTQVAKLIGGYWYFEHKTLYLFITPPGTPPDPIDDTPNRFAHDPAITWTMDKSQVRTRVYGKGASTRMLATLAAATDIIPVQEATMFNPAGGKAIAGVTPDGAASRVLTYTGVQLGGGGGLIGPGAAPSAPPTLNYLDGGAIELGVHRYAYTYVTASGESLPSPAASWTVGLLEAPTYAPTVGAATAGGGVEPGTHTYIVTFTNSVGETIGSPPSAPATTQIAPTTAYVTPPATAPTVTASPNTVHYSNKWRIGDAVRVAIVYVNANGATTAGPISNNVTIVAADAALFPTLACAIDVTGIPVSADPSVTGKRIYNQVNGVWTGYRPIAAATVVDDDFTGENTPWGPPPATNTATVAGPGAPYQTVPVTGILYGPWTVVARKLYRSSNGGPYKLVTTIPDYTVTTYTDTTPSASLGAVLPTTNTASSRNVYVKVGIGGAAVTARKVYRSKANVEPLQLLTTIADNTTQAITDTAVDASLGAAPPVGDTSGLTQPTGQVPAGASAILVANPAPFPDAGGWAIVGNGDQIVRYTGKTASSLSGIPATGPGALIASVSYNSTITAAPALTGVVGLLETLEGAPIHVWVQRDDPAAQAYMVALDGGGDGVYEHIVSDERRSEASLIQVCDAELTLYSRPLVTVMYATRDLKTKSGKTVAIALTSPAINENLTIQDVAIDEIGIARGLAPKFTVTASSVHHTFEAILQKLIRKAGA